MGRKPPARFAVIPAPIGGLNARDALTGMKPTDAVILENFIPSTVGIELRSGSATWASGLGGRVGSLMEYAPPTAAPRLFAAAGGKIFEVTIAGPVGAPMLSGLAGDAWRSVNFGTPGGAFLIAANGTDAPQVFNGSSWGAMTLQTASGYAWTLTPAKLFNPMVYSSRLWFIEKTSMRVWFGPLNAIAADGSSAALSMQTIDFASQCRFGGTLVAMACWTREGYAGAIQYAVFLTSRGEVLVFQGTDPTNAASWSKTGQFKIAPPIGTDCMLASGADIGVLTEQGTLPLSEVLSLSESGDEVAAITDKIKGLFASSYAAAPSLTGWQIIEYPKGGLAIVNAPRADGTFFQMVMNILTRKWCTFEGLPATLWSTLGDQMMFGTADGRVMQFGVGFQDNGATIVGSVLSAFSTFKSMGQKRFLLARPSYVGPLDYRPAMALKLDYDATRQQLAQGTVPPSGTPWFSPWYSSWGVVVGRSARWQGVAGVGQAAAIFLQAASNSPFRLDHIDISFEVGGVL